MKDIKQKTKKEIIKAIRLTYSSLESHLDSVIKDPLVGIKSKNAKEQIGGKNFHKKCVREYAFIIKVLADVL